MLHLLNYFLMTTLLGMSLSQRSVASVESWSKDYWAWGQGITTNSASISARENAQIEVDKLNVQCKENDGVLSVERFYGYCTVLNDPMFCPYQCYSCPIFGTATCKPELHSGDHVEASENASLYIRGRRVGSVAKGDQFEIVRIDGEWATLKKPDGTSVYGWISLALLIKASA